MISQLFTDKKFQELDYTVQLTVIYFASIGIREINYDQLNSNRSIVANIIKCLPDNDILLERHFELVLSQLKMKKFKMKQSQVQFIPPTFQLAYDYVIDNMDKLKDQKTIKAIKTDIEKFINYYSSVGWKVGKTKMMVNWKSALMKWMNNDWNKSEEKSSEVDRSIQTFLKLQQSN